MKAILRSAILGAAAATTLAIGSPANAAPGAAAFTGTANIVCFGCGSSTGTASLNLTGTVSGSATASFTVNEPASDPDDPPLCVVTGSANGSVTGAVNVDFNWLRVGAVAVITTSGDVNGAGVAAFAVTAPLGNPCGGAVTASVVGAVAGV